MQYLAVDAPATMGIVEQSFRLADNIPEGDWEIEATLMVIKVQQLIET